MDPIQPATPIQAPVNQPAQPSDKVLLTKEGTPDTGPSPEAAPIDPKYIRSFNKLAQKEKTLREQEQVFKQKEKDLEALKQYADLPKRMQENPLKTLTDLGFSYEKATEMFLNGNQSDIAVKSEIAQLREELTALKRKDEDSLKVAKKEQVQEMQKQFLGSIHNHIESNAQAYEILRAFGAQGTIAVYNAIENYYNQTGNVPEISQVCNTLEQHYTQEVAKYKDVPKFKKMFIENPQEPQVPSRKEPQKQKTLSNKMQAQTSKSAKPLSDEERRKRAIAIINSAIN